MSSTLTPALEGLPGPGETTSRQRRLDKIDSTRWVSLAITTTRTSRGATAAKSWRRFQVKES